MVEDERQRKNNDTLLSLFSSGKFDGNLPSARFSNPSVSKQSGVYQKLISLVFLHLEICPDVSNPLGGGATVSFTSGDKIEVPLVGIEQVTYSLGDFLGRDSFTMTRLSDGSKFTNLYLKTNTSGKAEIVINHTIPATASTYLIEGVYLVRD